jgi:hypothetical protein
LPTFSIGSVFGNTFEETSAFASSMSADEGIVGQIHERVIDLEIVDRLVMSRSPSRSSKPLTAMFVFPADCGQRAAAGQRVADEHVPAAMAMVTTQDLNIGQLKSCLVTTAVLLRLLVLLRFS